MMKIRKQIIPHSATCGIYRLARYMKTEVGIYCSGMNAYDAQKLRIYYHIAFLLYH